jgi:TetR/AcrR family transcriptional regulator, fatty acid biosynthesis regulator
MNASAKRRARAAVRAERPDMAAGKALLMAAAARIAARQGAHSLVLREVAREAGLNHNTFYRHFDSIEAMMHLVVEDFGAQLRRGLSEARAQLRPGDPPTPKVVGWLFDFARMHRDVFVVAMRECYGPPGPIRDSIRNLLEQLTDDMQRDLTMIGYLPNLDARPLRRAVEVSVHEVFRYCIEYLEAPRRRQELVLAAQQLSDTMLAGLVAINSSSIPDRVSTDRPELHGGSLAGAMKV